MKKILMALSLLLLIGCAGRHYKMTEGPFRGRFAKAFSFSHVNKPWTMGILFDGVLPTGPVHVEGYADINGVTYYQLHSDLPYIRARWFTVKNKFTMDQYCEAVGRPMDRFDLDRSFWNRNQSPGDPSRNLQSAAEDAASGEVHIRFQFYEFAHTSTGEWVSGRMILEAKTTVKLECPQCQCGGQLR